MAHTIELPNTPGASVTRYCGPLRAHGGSRARVQACLPAVRFQSDGKIQRGYFSDVDMSLDEFLLFVNDLRTAAATLLAQGDGEPKA